MTDTRDKMAEIYNRRDEIRAGHLDANGDSIADAADAAELGFPAPAQPSSFDIREGQSVTHNQEMTRRGWTPEAPDGPPTVGVNDASSFKIKDSGERQRFDSGMVRDTQEGKTDYTLILDGPMFDRWAVHMTKGASKYAARNWMQANGDAELERFKQSALRHFLQWFRGEVDEDHAAAVFFNLNGAEYVKAQEESA